jgi:mRNA interferase RelE/StbE
MFEIELSKLARDFLHKCEKTLSDRIIAVLERASIRPQSHAIRLVGSPYHKIRAGDYRIIVDIQHNKLVILVVEIGHRKNIYK